MLAIPKTLLSPSLFLTTICFLTTLNPKPTQDEPSSTYYDTLINTTGHEKDFATVHHLLNKRVKGGFFNTINTFRFISTDLSVLADLLQTLSTLDKVFPQKSEYDSLVARLSKLNLTDEALRVVVDMIRGEHGANVSTFHPILNALTRKKNMKEAWGVMDLMREDGIRSDLTAYNYLLTAYYFTRDMTSVAGVLTRIGEEGMEADTRTYDSLVLGACRIGKVEKALMVLRRTLDVGLPVLYSTHADVIGALLRLGYYAQAREFVMSYGGKDKAFDTENFGILAGRLINSKRFDEAK